ncbi:MAG: hypothetical protein D6696_17745, partial [Acidobacteria bacterium]
AGRPLLAGRLTLQRELPLLPPADVPPRLDGVVANLLGQEDERADRLLRAFLGRRRSGAPLLLASAGWLVAREDPAAAFERWQRLWQESDPPLKATAEDLATFLTRLAISPLAGRVAEAAAILARAAGADLLAETLGAAATRLEGLIHRAPSPAWAAHLPGGVAGLLAARRHLGIAPPELDRRLLALAGRALVFCDASPAAEAGALRRALGHFLSHLLAEDRLLVAAGDESLTWRHLLCDELLRSPPAADPSRDPRYHAALLLAWHEWRGRQERSQGAGVTAVARLLLAAGVPRDWHRRELAAALPAGDASRARGEALLDQLVA